MPFYMTRRVAEDGAMIDQTSHWEVDFFAGRRFEPDFESPVTFDLDTDIEGRRMPTFFTVPAFVAQREFASVLSSAGVDNIDIYPARIDDPETGATFTEYVLINIIGSLSVADLSASEVSELGPGMRMIDKIVLKDRAPREVQMFRLAEDPLKIIVSDAVATAVRSASLNDVYLERL